MADSLMARFREKVLDKVLEKVLEKVLTFATNKIFPYLGFNDNLATLQESLEYIQTVVRDAEQKQLTSHDVRNWLKDVKDVADGAQIVLDEIEYETLRHKVGAKSSNKPILSPFWMAEKIKSINDSLARIKREAADHKLQQLPIPVYKNEETDSGLDEFGVVGREDDEKELIQSLTESTAEEKLTIIPIAGMGGIGKTTLAKRVYNNEKVQGHFGVKVWVCAGVKVDDVTTILVQILEILTRRKMEVQTREIIIQSLKEELGGKKYLLVLDDVWNEEGGFWEKFRSCMLKVNEAYGNFIIVTTRSKELSTNALTTNASQTSKALSLHQLSDDQCLSIIKERAIFPNGGPTEDLVDSIGKEIARMCCGLPLAAKVVGGMLRSKKSEEWQSVRDSLVQGSSHEDPKDPISKILKLSYDNLPNPLLKHCFSYCSIFRKDTLMEKAQLIQLWMALGFLEVVEGARHKDMEEVGHEFFNTLVQNSLFQDVEKDVYGNITGCKMHDLAHDLALSISGTPCSSLEGSMKNDLILKVKDVALYDIREDKMFEELKKYKAGYVRTLFLEGASSIITEHISLNHFKCLRILNLKSSGLKMLPDSIGELIHLRYLDLSYNLELDVLPRSIGKLYHLQTLRLRGCSDKLKLPNEVGNLISLRHLYIDEECNIASFNIGRFTCLQTLEYFRVGKEKGHCIEVLGPLKNLRGMLKLGHLQNVSSKSEASNADLIGKLVLNNLEYAWNYNNDADNGDVLEGLQAPPNLKVLNINFYRGENFPEWVMKMAVIGMDQKLLPLHNLMHITFSNCGRCERVPMLGQLPHLQELNMENMENVRCIDESFYGYCGSSSSCGKPPRVIFPALRILKILFMKNLEKWMDVNVTRKYRIGGGEGSSGSGGGWLVFPHLEVLELYDCPMINYLPYEALTGAHLSLRRLEISGCDNLGTIPTLQGFTSLEELRIGNCKGLTSIPMLGQLPHLQKLEMGNMENVRCIDESFYGYCGGSSSCGKPPRVIFPALRILKISNMFNLGKWMDVNVTRKDTIGGGEGSSGSGGSWLVFPHLEVLYLIKCPMINSLPYEALTGAHLSLNSLVIEDCNSLETIPTLQGFTSLEELIIRNCNRLTSIPMLGQLPHLQKLEMSEMENVRCIDESFYGYCGSSSSCGKPPRVIFPALRNLRIVGMLSLETWMDVNVTRKDRIGGGEGSSGSGGGWLVFPHLEVLELYDCPMINSLPYEALTGAHLSLKRLVINGCDNLGTIPTLQGFTSLEELRIGNCKGLASIPMLGQLPHLQKLEMGNMENVRCIDESFYGYCGGSSSCGKPPRVIFPALRILKISNMFNLGKWMDVNVTRKDTIGGGEGSSGSGGGWLVFPHLEVLYLHNCPKINSLPYEALTGAHLSLKRLVINGCDNLGTIPTLQGFTSLEELRIGNCKGLASIPMLGQLPHLQKLEMWNMENVKCIDESFYGYCGSSSSCGKPPRVIFPALRNLRIEGMLSLEKWMDVNVTRKGRIGGGEGSSGSGGGWLVFPHLEELEIIDCPMINSLPYEALTGAHLSLKRLEINGCDNLGTIPTFQGFTSLELVYRRGT